MSSWFMVTVVGRDRPGIVARVSSALYEGGCDLGEASMMRLGGNFTMMAMVGFEGSMQQLNRLLEPESLDLRLHVDPIQGALHHHVLPDIRITVTQADRAGIVAQVTAVLAEAGLHILDLVSDVAGTETQPLYIMHIEGRATAGVKVIEAAVTLLAQQGIDIRCREVEAVVA